MRNYKKLLVWQEAHELVLAIHTVTKSFPPAERYGLVEQLRRAVVSIAANLAEGCGRRGDRELASFISIAAGSASEVEYHLLASRDLGYLTPQEHQHLDAQIAEIKKMLRSFLDAVRSGANG